MMRGKYVRMWKFDRMKVALDINDDKWILHYWRVIQHKLVYSVTWDTRLFVSVTGSLFVLPSHFNPQATCDNVIAVVMKCVKYHQLKYMLRYLNIFKFSCMYFYTCKKKRSTHEH